MPIRCLKSEVSNTILYTKSNLIEKLKKVIYNFILTVTKSKSLSASADDNFNINDSPQVSAKGKWWK